MPEKTVDKVEDLFHDCILTKIVISFTLELNQNSEDIKGSLKKNLQAACTFVHLNHSKS